EPASASIPEPSAEPAPAGIPRPDGHDAIAESPASSSRQAIPAIPATPAGSPEWWASIPFLRLRRIDPRVPTYGSCAPYPSQTIFDKALFSLCHVREGFIGDARRFNAASGIDYDVRLRSQKDFAAYAPRAVGIALLEPLPN